MQQSSHRTWLKRDTSRVLKLRAHLMKSKKQLRQFILKVRIMLSLKAARASRVIRQSTSFTTARNFTCSNQKNSILPLTTARDAHLQHPSQLILPTAKSRLKQYSWQKLSSPAQLKTAGR